MVRKEKILLFIVLLICFSLLYVSLKPLKLKETTSEKNYKCPDCNVILITIDALRADHLGCYGYHRNTSPNIDKLASRSLLFKQAISQAPYTLASEMSIFTSLYSSVHRVGYKSFDARLDKNISTLAEILKMNNYSTAGFVDLPYLSSTFGFNRGFDLYDEKGILDKNYSGIEKINERVFPWLAKNQRNKFFLFLHYSDVHCSYTPPKKFLSLYYPDYKGNLTLEGKCGNPHFNSMNLSKEDINYIIAAYDGEIRYTDENIGKLLEQIKSLNLFNKTIIILTADHGEELKDHGLIGHGITLYDEVIHVPLVIYHPHIGNKSIDTQVQSIDIMPTVLDLLNVEIPNQTQGRSLLPIIFPPNEANSPAFSETTLLIAIRYPNFKFIYNKMTQKQELYDLKNDFFEQIDISEQMSEKTQELKQEIFSFIQNNTEKLNMLLKASESEMNQTTYKEIKEKLRELGYVQ